jgi:hypothetical protein
MKPSTTPQPEWLRAMSCCVSEGSQYKIIVDGVRFAVVQLPGGTFMNGRVKKYGPTNFDLVDKMGEPRNGTGIMRCNVGLQHGGRANKAKRAEWKKLVDQSDALGTFATEDAKSLILENMVDSLQVYLDTHLSEAQYRAGTTGMALHGKTKEYWEGQAEAHKNFRQKLKELAKGLVKDENES